jgi:aminomethyltransferase
MTLMSVTEPQLRTTPLHDDHVAAEARMVDFAGWSMPLHYESTKAEHMAVREAAGMFDVSHMGRIEVTGPRAEDALQLIVSNDVSKMLVGDSQYSVMCRPDGGVIDDLLVYRLADEHYLVIVNAANHDGDLAWILEHSAKFDEKVQDISARHAMIAVQGPGARTILEQLADGPLPKRSKVKHLEFAGADCIVCATGYTGEAGAEVLVPAKDASKLWTELVDAGVLPCGLGARDTLRLEACLPLYGNELSLDRDPISAGLGNFVAEDTDFIGSDTIEAIRHSGPAQTLVAFMLDGPGIARQDNEIVEGGVVTSGTLSPLLGVGIGLAYVDSALTEPGTPLKIDVRGRERPAKVVKPPFHRMKESSVGGK